MKNIFFTLLVCFSASSGFLQSEIINQPVVNVFVQPQLDTEVTSQVIYGNYVEVVDRISDWVKIKMIDDVEGWIPSSFVTLDSAYEASPDLRPLKNLFASIYRVTDTTPYPPLLTLPYGAKVKLLDLNETEERWIKIELVSGETAWVQQKDINFDTHVKNLDEMIVFSKKFLNLPYYWGGTSTFGYDCSGFTQMLFKEMGFLIPRNSRDQAKCDLFTEVTLEELEAGDLIFFGETKIIHVGLYLGNEEYLHCNVREIPIVMVSHLKTGKYPFYTARRINPAMIETYQAF